MHLAVNLFASRAIGDAQFRAGTSRPAAKPHQPNSSNLARADWRGLVSRRLLGLTTYVSISLDWEVVKHCKEVSSSRHFLRLIERLGRPLCGRAAELHSKKGTGLFHSAAGHQENRPDVCGLRRSGRSMWPANQHLGASLWLGCAPAFWNCNCSALQPWPPIPGATLSRNPSTLVLLIRRSAWCPPDVRRVRQTFRLTIRTVAATTHARTSTAAMPCKAISFGTYIRPWRYVA